MKLNATFIWVSAVILASVGLFVYLVRQEVDDITPRMPLSYFGAENELVAAVRQNLVEMEGKSLWLGVEPGKDEQLGVVLAFKNEMLKQNPNTRIIVDLELGFSAEALAKIGAGDVIALKQNLYPVGEKLQQLEKEKTPYLVVTAAIYSTSLLPKNPLYMLKKTYPIETATLSLGYFPLRAEDEKAMAFTCRTADDHAGTSPWACHILNKSRFMRKRIMPAESKPWILYLDQSGPYDFILVLTKRN